MFDNKTPDCFHIMDLIDFTHNRLDDPDLKKQIRNHLRTTNCPYCWSWINSAEKNPPEKPIVGQKSLQTKKHVSFDESFQQLQKDLDLT